MGNKRKLAAGGRTLDRLVRRWQSQAGYWRAGSAFLRSEGHITSAERELGRCEALLQCARELRTANAELSGGEAVRSDDLLDLAHEIWATAQLLPGEGIEDGVERIVDILKPNAVLSGNGERKETP